MSVSSGNESGKVFEAVIGDILKRYCITYEPQYKTCVVGGLGNTIKVDFYLSYDGYYVEARWQDVAGSTDKKNIALVHEIRDYYDRPTVVVFGGSEKHKSIKYCKERSGVRSLVDGMGLDEFIVWCRGISSRTITTTASYDARQNTLFIS